MELTVRENISSTGATSASREHSSGPGGQLLDFVQLTDRGDSRVEPLSGGMKRRLTIARSLVNDPTSCCWTSRRPVSIRRQDTGLGPAVSAEAAWCQRISHDALHG